MTSLGILDFVLAAFAFIVTALFLWRCRETPPGRTLRRVAAGLMLLALAGFPFALAPTMRDDNRRIHLLAAVGAAMVLTAIVSRLPSRPRAVLADALRVVHRRGDILFYVFGRAIRFPWNGTPVAGPEGVTVKWPSGNSLLVPYGNVVAFRAEPDGSLWRLSALPKDLFPFEAAEGYAPIATGGSGPLPPRLATLVP